MIRVLLYDGVSAHEAASACAAFHAAGQTFETVATDAILRSHEGMRLVPGRIGVQALASSDAVFLPGGDVTSALADAALARALRARRGHWVLASGNAVHLAERAGLTDGRRIARPPSGPPLEGTVPTRLAADGRLATCTGGDAAIDLALHYLAHAVGADAAAVAAERLGRTFQPFALGADESRA